MFTVACGGRSNTTTISGTIYGASNSKLLLRQTTDNTIFTVDSTRTDSTGNFKFIIGLETPTFFILQMEGEFEPILLLAERGELLSVHSKKGEFGKTYTLAGSKGSELVRELNFKLNQTLNRIDSLSYNFRRSREHPRFDSIKAAIDSAYFQTIESHRLFTINFVRNNCYSLASVLALYQQYDSDRRVLNKREDFELFALVDSVLFPIYPENPLVINLHENVKKISNQLVLYDRRHEMISVGEPIPLFPLPVFEGDSINLLNLKFRYALIDFWATWCNDCIPNNRKLLAVYNIFETKGFQIVQISLDDNPKDLKKLLLDESLPWIHIADFKQWNSPMVDSFQINSIPSNYLIDRNGVIVASNLSPIELKDLLEKLLP
jgi:peroxiredoxin